MNRYPGAPPFQDTSADQALFFGREEEITGLSQRLLGTRLLVLYGGSGLGKTSLLKAGVFPKLREQGLFPLYSLVRQESPAGLLTEIIEAASAQLGRSFVPGERTSFWEFFKTSMFWRGDVLLTPVLVLDQFEEVFTLKSPEFRRELARELGSLVSGRMPDIARERRQAGVSKLNDTAPDVKIILSLREEYVGALQELAPEIPGLLQDRYRLSPLSRQGAVDAIQKPAALETVPGEAAEVFASRPFAYEPEAQEKMLRFLEDQSGAIEPWQLQLLCQHVEQEVIRQSARTVGRITVGDSMLGGESGMESVLRDFYSRTIGELSPPYRRRARVLCEEGLLTAEGHRLPLSQSQILKDYGLEQKALDILVDKRLLRREKRLGSVFYELSHDSLARPILEGRAWRLPKKLRQGLWIGGPTLVALLVVLFVWNVQLRQAREDIQRERDRAEELVGFLIGEEWLEKLRAIGRSEILRDVQRRIEDYLDEGPIDSRKRPAYLRNRALAHRNQGELFVDLGNLTKAGEEFRSAEAIFQKFMEADPKNPIWAKELAVTLVKRSSVDRDQGKHENSLAAAQKAVEILQGVLAANPKDGDAKLRIARAQLRLASTMDDLGRKNEALAKFDEVVSLAEGMIAMQSPADPKWRYHLMAALDGRGGILLNRERPGDFEGTKQAYEKSLELARELTKQDPLNALYRYRLGIAVNRIGNIRIREGTANLADALKAYLELHETFAELVRRDPQNLSWARDFAMTAGLLGDAYLDASNKPMALKFTRQASDEINRLAARDRTNVSWESDTAVRMRQLGQALLANGNLDQAIEAFEKAVSISRQIVDRFPANMDGEFAHFFDLLFAGDALQRKKESKAALARYAAARDTIERLIALNPEHGPYRRQLATIVQRIALAQGQDMTERDRASHLETGLAAARQAVRLAPEDVYAHTELARVHYEMALGKRTSSPDAALAGFRESLAAAESAVRVLPENYIAHNWADLANREIGKVHEGRGENKEALSAYRRALDHAGKAHKSRPEDEALTNNVAGRNTDIGELHLKIANRLKSEKQWDAALRAYREAEKAAETAARLKPTQATRHQKVGSVRIAVGDLYRDIDDLENAMSWYGKSLAVYETAVRVDPRNALPHNDVFLAHNRIGAVLSRHKDHARALDAHRAGITPIRTATDLRPNDPVLWNNRYTNQVAIANALLALGKSHVETIETRRHALVAIEKAAALDPKNIEYRSQLGVANWRLGRALEDSGQLKESQAQYRKSVEAAQSTVSAAEGNPKDPLRWKSLSIAHEWVGRLHVKQGQAEPALHSYRASVAASDRAVQLDPNSTDLRLQLVRSLQYEASVLVPGSSEARGQRVSALDRALIELRRLNQQDKLDAEWKATLRDMEQQRRQLADQK